MSGMSRWRTMRHGVNRRSKIDGPGKAVTSSASLLAGDPIAIAVEMRSVPRLATAQRGRACRPNGCAIGVIDTLYRRRGRRGLRELRCGLGLGRRWLGLRASAG